MKNNKGFTLVELLVVVVILIGISLIAVPNIASSLSKNKQKQIDKEVEILMEYANTYATSNIDLYNCLKQGGYISLIELAEEKNIQYKNFKESNDDVYAIYQNGEIVSSTTHPKQNCLQ